MRKVKPSQAGSVANKGALCVLTIAADDEGAPIRPLHIRKRLRHEGARVTVDSAVRMSDIESE